MQWVMGANVLCQSLAACTMSLKRACSFTAKLLRCFVWRIIRRMAGQCVPCQYAGEMCLIARNIYSCNLADERVLEFCALCWRI